MKVYSGSGPGPYRPWLFGALALLFLTACATTRLAEEERPSDDDRVDIGYGTVNKDHLVGSVATFHVADEQVVNPRTLAQMLVRIPGVQVSELSRGRIGVRIRGGNSFLGGTRPLLVVDGMIFSGELGGINPASIESITVLKNAGETAIYGSRGANGVILIKTRGGSK